MAAIDVELIRPPSTFAPRAIVIADDHPLFRTALRSALELSFTTARFEEATDVVQLRRILSNRDDVELVGR